MSSSSRLPKQGNSAASTAVCRILGPIAAFAVFGSPLLHASPLDDRITAFQKARDQNEAAVIEILRAGLSENRSAQAFAATRGWLTRNPKISVDLTHQAAQAAERAGDLPAAVSFYRKLVDDPQCDATIAAEVVPVLYRLLINSLGSPESAYLLMRDQGDRLRQYGTVRRFDVWFIEQTIQRDDPEAACKRLSSIAADAQSQLASHRRAIEWLCTKLENFHPDSSEWQDSARKLAAAPGLAPDLQARIQWATEVVAYHKLLDSSRNLKRTPDAAQADAALAAAGRLLEVLPDQGPFIVIKGWSATYDDPKLGNAEKRLNHEAGRKLAQLFGHLPRMRAELRDDLLATRLADGKGVFPAPAVRQWLIANPGALDSIDAAAVTLVDNTLTPEQAKVLAGQLARNPHFDAAVIRLLAVDKRKFAEAMEQIMKTEAWRFSDMKQLNHQIWNHPLFKQGGNMQQEMQKFQKHGPRYETLQNQIAAKATTPQRLEAFQSLLKDLTSPSPVIPGSLDLWAQLFRQAPDPEVIQMIETLMADLGNGREALLRRALDNVSFGKTGRMPWQAAVSRNQFVYNQEQTRKQAAALITKLGERLKADAAKGEIQPTLLGMWLHTVDTRQPAAQEIMRALRSSKGYEKLDPAYRVSAADKEHFGAFAADPDPMQPTAISRELLELPANAAPAQVEAALATVMARAASAPQVVTVIGLTPVAKLPEWKPETRRHVLSLFREQAALGKFPANQGYEALIERLARDFRAEGAITGIETHAAGLWHAVSCDDARGYRCAGELANCITHALKSDAPSIAMTLARTAQKSAIQRILSTANQEQIKQLWALIGRSAGEAAVAIGAVDIQVNESDPSYPIHQSHSEFVLGNLDTSWSIYVKHADKLSATLRSLSPEYGLWLLEKAISVDDAQLAESLIKDLTIWSRDAEGSFTIEQQAALKIAYADLALRKGALPTARAWYRKVADAAEYRGTPSHVRAALGSVRVDRLSRNFSAALEELEKLMRLPDPDLRMKVRYARAEVMMDQENYAEALDELEAVLRREAKHPDALILRGKIHYQMRKLVEASEIEVGTGRNETVLVPGQSLKINLRDPSLQVSGLGADIEVEIRTTSGDVERLLLHQFGDTKDKFRAEITTALGAPVHDDKVLQVLGKDEIRYGYSQRFRQRMKDLPPDPQDVITVASDAELALTAGTFPPREGERRLNISELGLSTAQAALGTRAVRPGNPVYLRVIDPDHSFTPDIDEIHLELVASSGDVIRKLALKETGPYTGEFQAIVPTATAQPIAFASESSPGRDPNMTISPLEYPGWQGEVGNLEKQRTFGVDLNDNVPVKEMLVDGGAKGNTLSKVVVQTSMNGVTWTSCGRFPMEQAPWDGRPQFTSMPTYSAGSLPITNPSTPELPAEWLEKLEIGTMGKDVNYHSAYSTNLQPKNEHLVGTPHPDYPGLFRFRAVFHQPTQAIRTLRVTGLNPKDKQGNYSTIFLLDGKPADANQEDNLTIKRELKPGLHTIEVWTHMGRIHYLRAPLKLQCDAAGKTELIDCPDEMFDITRFPAEARKDLPQHATVTAEGSGLRIRFSEHAQARMIRLVICAYTSDAPMIRKVTLDDREGKKRLPVAVDYQQLRDNQQLEVLPGDQITARYEDPVSATPKRNRHERALGVAFNTGTITSSFLDYEVNKEGQRVLKLEPIRRFRLDDAVAIVIEDADLDSSSESDTVDCLITSDDGRKTTIKALETEPNSGRFIGRVFPVQGQPSRDSEIQIKPGGFITASYLDAENLDPGIPIQRKVSISHAQFTTPQLEAYTVSSEAVTPPPVAKTEVKAKPKDGNPTAVRTGGPEVYEIRRSLSYQHVPTAALGKTKLESLLNASLHFDVIAPHLALASSSEIQAYVQTDAARKAAGVADGNFDLTVPGTLKFKGRLEQAGAVVPLGYQLNTPPHAPTHSSPLEEGRFSIAIPLLLGDPPARSFATKSAAELPDSEIPDGLAVKAGDIIHVGFPWQDEKKEVHWHHLSFEVGGHAILDVMEGGYQQALTSAFVGEKVHLRMIAPNLDLGSGQDKVEVELSAGSGVSARYTLQETESHSGIFKSSFTISYATQPMPPQLPPVALNGLPVKYGDRITVRYQEQSFAVDVSKGADGLIEPFSKRYTGDEMAVRTSFTLAECYFELAKKHREMDQESLARREIAQARKLLAEALATHRDENLKAHAEYLLGNLAQEYADLSKNEESKLPMYQDALARFIKIPTDYPESEFAPKAQFKTALVYEKMGEIDNAVEEYVKLAYKYPDNELIPTVMSRLGGYFQQKGQQFKEKADPLREKKDDASVAEVLRLDQLSFPEFLKAAMVFSKLQQRFPDDPLAGMAGLRAGQNLMRAHKYERAVEQFKAVMDNPQYDDGDTRAQAVYWSGLSFERISGLMGDEDLKKKFIPMQNAYENYRRVTFDFPDSKWAKYARGRLADPIFADIIARENQDRQRMIDALRDSQKKGR